MSRRRRRLNRVRSEGLDPLPGKSNYFIGSDPSRWRTGVEQYSKVRYREVYRGIDLVYRGNQRQLEFDFEVGAGADPRAINLGFEGVESLRVDGNGDLVLEVSGGEVRQRRPCIYQTVDGLPEGDRGALRADGRQKRAFRAHGLRSRAFAGHRSHPRLLDLSRRIEG